MRINHHKRRFKNSHGFTLVEATVVVIISMMIAAMGLSLVSQQVFFHRILSNQRFIAEDAPLASNLLSRSINKADRFLIFGSVADAKNGTNPVASDGNALVLVFGGPGEQPQFTLIGFETIGGENQVNFYHRNGNAWPNSPSWTLTKEVDDLEFFLQQGVLRARFTGGNGAQMILSGSSQL